ncbi:tRNA (adenine37-N(6))-methyltransferase TrmN6 [Lachnospiraceae bacterium KM106-2]|nr:tRNA (adenine37-N(6))-methyltransferase TrmN6 [Lachnospiraceae bacterium KM106-2]
MDYLLPEERLDDLHRNNYKIIQHPKKFCFGIDAVLLSDYAKVFENETMLDLGTGTGIIPILVEAKTKGSHFTGLEIQEESAEMARRSVAYNQLEEKIDIVTGDIKEAVMKFGPASFHVVTSNPPYMNQNHGLVNGNMPLAIARHELLCTLDDVISQASKVLKMNGRFYMVHRPTRLVDIITTLRNYKLEPKQIRFVHPYADKEPNMVLVEAIKGGKPMIKVAPPLIVYKDKNVYTEEIMKIYGYEE